MVDGNSVGEVDGDAVDGVELGGYEGVDVGRSASKLGIVLWFRNLKSVTETRLRVRRHGARRHSCFKRSSA